VIAKTSSVKEACFGRSSTTESTVLREAADERVSVVGHEDLSLDPIRSFASLYERLGLPLVARARRTIADYTSRRNPVEVPADTPIARPLDSRTNVSNWTNRLSPKEIERVRRLTEASGLTTTPTRNGRWGPSSSDEPHNCACEPWRLGESISGQVPHAPGA
jgi:hypothetical protein